MGGLSSVWHDVECAAYTADLELWRTLADEAGGPILDLGCGTGRVALELAAHGFDVTGIDRDPALIDALRARARARALRVEAVPADARAFELGKTFALAILPMQVVQLLGGRDGRARMLAAVRRHLRPGGVLAAALANPFDGWSDTESLPPLPDVREEDGWVLSSTPVAVRSEDGAVAVDRLRQAVSPTGELSETLVTIVLDEVGAEELQGEGAAAGYRPLPARHVPETGDHVGSTVVLLEGP